MYMPTWLSWEEEDQVAGSVVAGTRARRCCTDQVKWRQRDAHLMERHITKPEQSKVVGPAASPDEG